MSDIAIRVHNLSKQFKIYQHPMDMVKELITRESRHKEFWALRDISFELKRGEMVAFIGRNGAGKSTLLKILTGTLDQTFGEVEVNGVVSSILELGTGFNAELTGRENIYMGGLCLGLTKEIIDQKIDWIIEFSELEHVMDQQFRTYSSGMQARLTFSTAVCIEPEILIIDEALAVGDVKFQAKCFDKLRKFRENNGTILLVSHDTNTINTFCDRAFMLHNGMIIEEGEPKKVTRLYYKMLFGESEEVAVSSTATQPDSSITMNESVLGDALEKLNASTEDAGITFGNGKARILEYGIYDQHGTKHTDFISGDRCTLSMKVLFYQDMESYTMGFLIRDARGGMVYGISTQSLQLPVSRRARGDVIDCSIDITLHITNGKYLLTAAIAEPDETQCDCRFDGLAFEVSAARGIFPESVVNMGHNLTTSLVGHVD